LVRARTGSGKTLAYCLPILHKILQKEENGNNGDGGSDNDNDDNLDDDNYDDEAFVKAVILVPTRELCKQVTDVIRSLTYYCDEIITVAALFSGKNSSRSALVQQEAMLRDRPSVLVSTPAGLLTHIKKEGSMLQSSLKKSVDSLVVDEADLVLSFGYASDVTEIMKYLPKICQGFLMSATLSPELNSLKKVVLHSPAVLKLEEADDNIISSDGNKSDRTGNLTQLYLTLSKKDKNLVLYVFLKLGLLKGKGLFFVNNVDGGYRLKLFLEQFHIRSAVLNAELPLRSRLNIIEQFNVGNFDYLIATDESTDVNHGNNKKKAEEVDDGVDDGSTDGREKAKVKKKSGKRKKDSEYGISRGVDFRGVSFVVNVDFPLSPESYTHRIGRTARGGAKGVALSLVEIDSVAQLDMLAQVQESQPAVATAGDNDGNLHSSTPMEEDVGDDAFTSATLQPTPLDFDLKEIEGFRYRVEDVSRAVTKAAIRETRAAELRAEILNSERLSNHFAENPSELQLLRHDRQATHISKVQDHLKNVPKYLLPRGMQVANQTRRKRRRRNNNNNKGQRRVDNDPLQSFDGDNVNLDGVVGEDDKGIEEFDDPIAGEEEEADSAAIGNIANRSTAGRNKWQEKHKRGKFSKKYQKKEKAQLGF